MAGARRSGARGGGRSSGSSDCGGATEHGEAEEKGEPMQGLTADSGAPSESSAKGWCGRRVAVDLGRPETKMTPPRTKRSSPGLLGSVRRERGSRRSCGACRGGAAVAKATVAVDGGDGRVRPRDRERRRRGNGHRGERERCGAARGVARVFQATRGRSRRWPDAWPRAPSACPCPPGARKGTTGTASWLGRPAGPLGQARLHSEVSAGGFSSFLSNFVFCNLF